MIKHRGISSSVTNANMFLWKMNFVISGILETVGHIPRKVSGHLFYLIGENEGSVDGFVLSTCYCLSSISSGGLEMPFMLTFRSLRYNTHQKKKNFKTKLYCYNHKKDNVEFEPDDEIHIDI